MDTTDPDIRFDESGRCNHCDSLEKQLQQIRERNGAGEDYLKRIVQILKSKGKGRKYDAVLGISGGVDSCYAAWLLSQYGVRLLLVHMDNGWNSDEANANIKKVASALKLDYESYVLDWHQFRDAQLAFLKASVIEAETPTDVAIAAIVHKAAARHRVKFIIGGGNLATEGILPKQWHYDSKDARFFKSVLNTFGSQKAKGFPLFGYQKEIFYKVVKGIRIIYPLNYIRFNKRETVLFLEKQIGWKYYGGKHHESRFTKFIHSYYLVKKFNIDYRKATYSSLITAGEMTRNEAVEILNIQPYKEEDISREMDFIAKKLGISRIELEEILASPPRSYNDYPNSKRKLEKLYSLYRKFFSKVAV